MAGDEKDEPGSKTDSELESDSSSEAPRLVNVENSQDTPAMAHAAAQVRPVSSACVCAAVLIITDATPRARAMPPAQP